MYRIVPFKSWHLEWVTGEAPPFDATILAMMEASNWRTVLFDDVAIFAGGTVPQWPGRTQLSAFLSPQSGPHMRFLTRATKEYIGKIEGRIEFTVRCDFDKGHRWARLLGFDVETYVMKRYGPLGEDHTMYVKHNEAS